MIPPREEQTHNDAAIVASYDILCGRNRDAIRSTGTQRFRNIVSTWVPQYVGAPSKFKKSIIVDKVVEAIKTDGGRFIQMKNQSDGTVAFAELSRKQVRAKVGHALRDIAAGQARRRSSIANKTEARRSSIIKKGQATNTLIHSKEVAARQMSVEAENIFSGIAPRQEEQPPQQQQQHQLPRTSALGRELLDLHLDCGESIQSIGTFTEEDAVHKMTAWDKNQPEVEERRCSEDVSIVRLDPAFEKEEQQHDNDDDWWIDALTEHSSSSNSSSLCDGVIHHDTITGAVPRPAVTALSRATTTTTSHLMLQLLSKQSIGTIHRQDLVADGDEKDGKHLFSVLPHSEDGPPLPEIVF